MKALLYKKNGTLKEIPIENIDTITGSSDGLCIQLAYGKGDVFCSFLTIEQDNSNIKTISDTILQRTN